MVYILSTLSSSLFFKRKSLSWLDFHLLLSEIKPDATIQIFCLLYLKFIFVKKIHIRHEGRRGGNYLGRGKNYRRGTQQGLGIGTKYPMYENLRMKLTIYLYNEHILIKIKDNVKASSIH